MQTYTCGVDPGLKGAIVVTNDQEIVGVYDMPVISTEQSSGKILHRIDPVALMAIFQRHPIESILIERVNAMPGQGVTSTFNFGHTFGTTEAVAALTGAKVATVRPAQWKAVYGLNGCKNASRALAAAMSSDEQPFKRKKDDGRAEAYLLAVMAHRNNTNENPGT